MRLLSERPLVAPACRLEGGRRCICLCLRTPCFVTRPSSWATRTSHRGGPRRQSCSSSSSRSPRTTILSCSAMASRRARRASSNFGTLPMSIRRSRSAPPSSARASSTSTRRRRSPSCTATLTSERTPPGAMLVCPFVTKSPRTPALHASAHYGAPLPHRCASSLRSPRGHLP